MTAEHNHPPACCCQNNQDHPEQIDGLVTCPACPHHGELARIAPILCPQCNAEIGQPHTDYCTLAPGRVWDGVLGQRVVAGGPRYDPQTAGPAVDLIEHAAGIIVESRKQPYTAPGHWAGALWEAGMLVAPGSGGPRYDPPDDEALCGFRSLGTPDQRCTYPPHRPSTRHSWESDQR